MSVDTISREESFAAAAGQSDPLAGLYFYSLLDCLVDLAHAVSLDFFERPQLYTKLAEDPATELAEAQRIATLRSRLGREETLPSKQQRQEIFGALFGGVEQVNGMASFARLRDDLVAAVTAYSESLFEKGEPMLRERAARTAVPLRLFLLKRAGASTTWSKQGALDVLTEAFAYPILRNVGVAAVFGLTPPVSEWPHVEDPNGDQLVEEISGRLDAISGRLGYAATNGTPLMGERFSNLQRAAIAGEEAITAIIEFSDANDAEALDRLISIVYIWGSALRDVQRGWIEAVTPMVELSSGVVEPA